MKKPLLDERFITTIQGKEFAVYRGLLDLAHQKGIQMIQVVGALKRHRSSGW